MNPLLVLAIVTIIGATVMTLFTLRNYEQVKNRHTLSGAFGTLMMGAAFLMVATPTGTSIEGAVFAVVAMGVCGAGAVAFYILAVRLWRVDHAPASTWAGNIAVAGSQRRLWSYDDPRWLTAEKWFAGACFLLFVYNVLAWQGIVGDEPPWRPLQSVVFSIALLLQPLAQLARVKSQRLSYALLAASMIALGLSFVVG